MLLERWYNWAPIGEGTCVNEPACEFHGKWRGFDASLHHQILNRRPSPAPVPNQQGTHPIQIKDCTARHSDPNTPQPHHSHLAKACICFIMQLIPSVVRAYTLQRTQQSKSRAVPSSDPWVNHPTLPIIPSKPTRAPDTYAK